MNIVEKLKYYRGLKGYSVNKLATLSGLSQSHIREIQLGNRNPTIDTLEIICDALGLSVVEFLSDETQYLLEENEIQKLLYSLNDEQKEGLKIFLRTITSPLPEDLK